jgi:hypothetical protein
MRQGVAVTDAVVQSAVADHRAHIERWSTELRPELQPELQTDAPRARREYMAEPRFTADLDKVTPGFAQFLRDAIAAS